MRQCIRGNCPVKRCIECIYWQDVDFLKNYWIISIYMVYCKQIKSSYARYSASCFAVSQGKCSAISWVNSACQNLNISFGIGMELSLMIFLQILRLLIIY